MRFDLEKEGSKDYLKLSYLLLCAATLKYPLNSIYIENVNLKYKAEINKDIAESFVGLSFKKKLQIAPIIISDNQYKFKKDHHTINILNELIVKRNKILHNKSYFKQLNLESDGSFLIGEEKVTKIDNKKCLSYGEALTKFYNGFVIPARGNSLVETDFLIKINNEFK